MLEKEFTGRGQASGKWRRSRYVALIFENLRRYVLDASKKLS